jgi:hypothetical protein
MASSVKDAQTFLSDRSVPVCLVGGPGDGTDRRIIWTIIVEHRVPSVVLVTPSPSDRTPWLECRFAGGRLRRRHTAPPLDQSLDSKRARRGRPFSCLKQGIQA